MEKIQFNGVCDQINGKPVLDNVSFSVADAELFMIEDPTLDSAKSILNLLSESCFPKKGRIVLRKFEEEHTCSNTVGFVRNFTLRQTLTLALLSKRYNKSKIVNRIHEIASYFFIENLLDRKIRDCTKSQQSLISIVKAIITQPSVLLLNEFTSKLTHKKAVLVMTYLLELCVDHGVTVVLIENDKSLHPFASRILTLERGKVKKISGESVDLEGIAPLIKI